MFEVSITTHFSAAHHLNDYEGNCAGQHGHNWEVDVHVCGEQLNDTGILVDFRRLRSAVDEILEEFDHSDLNTLALFMDKNPTSENIARHLHSELSSKVNCDQYKVCRVCVRETRRSAAAYWQSGAR